MKGRIVLLGPPAAGKGTQAEMINKRYGIPVTSPGSILRAEMRLGSPLGTAAGSLSGRGKLLPDQTVIDLVSAWLSEQGTEFIFDGFPRTLGQAVGIEALLERRNTPIDVVLSLEASSEVLLARVASRAVCFNCGLIVSIGLHVAGVTDSCPRCDGSLVRREDDSPVVFAERMRQHRVHTEPLLDYFGERHILRSINSEGEPEAVFARVTAILEGK